MNIIVFRMHPKSHTDAAQLARVVKALEERGFPNTVHAISHDAPRIGLREAVKRHCSIGQIALLPPELLDAEQAEENRVTRNADPMTWHAFTLPPLENADAHDRALAKLRAMSTADFKSTLAPERAADPAPEMSVTTGAEEERRTQFGDAIAVDAVCHFSLDGASIACGAALGATDVWTDDGHKFASDYRRCRICVEKRATKPPADCYASLETACEHPYADQCERYVESVNGGPSAGGWLSDCKCLCHPAAEAAHKKGTRVPFANDREADAALRADYDRRERLGRAVRAAQLEWAAMQPPEKRLRPLPWETVSSDTKEECRRIGESLADMGKAEAVAQIVEHEDTIRKQAAEIAVLKSLLAQVDPRLASAQSAIEDTQDDLRAEDATIARLRADLAHAQDQASAEHTRAQCWIAAADRTATDLDAAEQALSAAETRADRAEWLADARRRDADALSAQFAEVAAILGTSTPVDAVRRLARAARRWEEAESKYRWVSEMPDSGSFNHTAWNEMAKARRELMALAKEVKA